MQLFLLHIVPQHFVAALACVSRLLVGPSLTYSNSAVIVELILKLHKQLLTLIDDSTQQQALVSNTLKLRPFTEFTYPSYVSLIGTLCVSAASSFFCLNLPQPERSATLIIMRGMACQAGSGCWPAEIQREPMRHFAMINPICHPEDVINGMACIYLQNGNNFPLFPSFTLGKLS